MMQSPMYLSIVPRCAMMISLIGVSKRLISRVGAGGFDLNPSEIAVNPRRSQNMIVIGRVSPPSCKRSGCAASTATISRARYWRMRRPSRSTTQYRNSSTVAVAAAKAATGSTSGSHTLFTKASCAVPA